MSIYQFDGKLLRIEDPVLKISFTEKFAPLLIPKKPERGMKEKSGHFLECFAEKAIPYAWTWIQDKKFDGEYLLVFPSQKVKGRQFYKNGLLHGPSSYFTESGSLLAESWYLNGLQQGKCTWYYSNKSLYSSQRYRDGQWEGMQLFYYQDGTIKSELSYKAGKLDGTSRLFHPDGVLDRLLVFEHGALLKAEIAPAHAC